MAEELTLRGIVSTLEKDMQCNCDLDNWTPEEDTRHSWVCRIHKKAKAMYAKQGGHNART